MKKPFIACGVMSGTSRDGIDVAVIEIAGRFPTNRIKLLHAETSPYPRWLVRELTVPTGHLDAEKVTTLHFFLGEIFGKRVMKALESAGLDPEDVAVIGSHGQTLLHRPGGVKLKTNLVRSTLQIASGAVIAQVTGIDTVSDFRSADIAVGGEGAPLVPVFDYVALRSKTKSRVALNIGGIANLTALPKGGSIRDIWSFDTGPGNCMVDTAVRILTKDRLRCDRNGRMAKRGRVDRKMLAEILSHSYFKRKPPKSTGWGEFGQKYTEGIVWKMLAKRRSKQDILRTVTEATCESIAQAVTNLVYSRMEVDEVVVTGGGGHNPVIMDGIRGTLSGVRVDAGEAFGIFSDAKEAMAFAYLAYLNLKRIPGNVISQNDNLKPAVLGSLYPG
jgi:anhydro-N-acetylmuramic acid kinase